MGTHAKMAITTKDGHWCQEVTMDGATLMTMLLNDWSDAETNGEGFWKPMDPDPTDAQFVLHEYAGSGIAHREHEDQEFEWIVALHVDFTRRVLGVDEATYAQHGAPGHRFSLSPDWTLEWFDGTCPGQEEL